MYIKEDYGFSDLQERCWSGAIDTLNNVEEAGLCDELMKMLEEVFLERIPDMTEVNDFLLFETEYIYEQLGLDEDGNIIEDE